MSSRRSKASRGEHEGTGESRVDEITASQVTLRENLASGTLNVVQQARAYATLKKELGLTYKELAKCSGRTNAHVGNRLRLLNLSDEILAAIEDGELGIAHALALLVAGNPQTRSELARAAIQDRWSCSLLEQRARESNRSEGDEEAQASQRALDEQRVQADSAGLATARAVAQTWGDVLGVEVRVKILHIQGLRVEVAFHSPEAAVASAALLGETLSRDVKHKPSSARSRASVAQSKGGISS
jgi:ParB-like chromosome segregation protein Spo0J